MSIIDPSILEISTLEDLEKFIELDEWEKIEWAERRASEKALKFIKAFFDRADDTGRRCSKFVAIGGNRSSKTFTTGRGCFSKYLRDFARNGDLFWAGSPNLDKSMTGPQKEVWDALPAAMFMGRSWDSKVGFGGHATVKIRTRDGGHCTVKFRSCEQGETTFESDKLRGIWWDENLPEALYYRLLPRLIDLQGFFLYSDINNQAWPIETFAEAEPGAAVYYQNFSMFDNAANLPAGAIEEFMAGLPQDEIDLRVHGKPGAMEGIVFKQYFDHIHAIDPFIGGIPDYWPRWRLIDFGETSPTACSWVTLADNEDLHVYREHYDRGHSVYANAKMIHEASGSTYHEVQRDKDELHEKPWVQIVVDKPGEKYVANYLDPACFGEDNGSRLTLAQQYSDAGIPCKPWPRANVMSQHARVARLKYILEKNKFFIWKPCTSFRREMKVWKHDLDKNGKPKAGDAYERGNDHLIDGVCGFLATSPTFAQPVNASIVGKGKASGPVAVKQQGPYIPWRQ